MIRNILLVLLAVFTAIQCLAEVIYDKDPTGYAEGNQVRLKVYIHEDDGELRLRVGKNDGEDFWADGHIHYFRDGDQIAYESYNAGADSVSAYVPLDFTTSSHEYQARVDTGDGSGNQFWTGEVDVWGEWQNNEPHLGSNIAGTTYDHISYNSSSSSPNIHIDEGSCIEVLVDSGEFDLHSDGSNVAYRFWRSPELEFTDINSSVSRVTLHSDVDPGTYYVTAYAGNGEGKIDSDTIEVVVYEPVPPTPTPIPPTATPTPVCYSLDLALIASKGPTGTGRTELHVADGSNSFQTFVTQMGTGLGYVNPANGFLQLVDFGLDGDLDLALIASKGPTGTQRTELHVLNGSNGYQSFETNMGTGLGYVDPANGFLQLVDFGLDGDLDLALIACKGPTGTQRTELHVLNGSNGYQSFEANMGTGLGYVDPANGFLQLVDFGLDGDLDLALIACKGPTGTQRTELHVLYGSNGYQSFETNMGTGLGYVDPANGFLQLVDFGLDGDLDLALIACKGPTGTGGTELHVLNGSTGYQYFEAQMGTGLGYVDPADAFIQLIDWENDGDLDLVLIMGINTGSGHTEIHVIDGSTSYQSFEAQLATCIGPVDPANGFLQLVPF
ncbi:MAG: hypothetical protein PHU71_05800 [Candidatus Gracilibacteria bacterium]|nr:hypothetical protein [Candidatus Gracilibacteria bacterium]